MAVSFVRRARFVGDDRRIANVVVSSTGFLSAVVVGDMVFIDPAGSLTDAGKCITFTDITDAGTKAQNQTRASGGFAGVAVSRGAAAGDTIQVAAGGVFSFPCTSGTYVAGQLVGPEGTGSAGAVGVSPTTLVGVATAGSAIGRVTRGGTTVTTIEVEIKSRIFGGTVTDADLVTSTLTASTITGDNLIVNSAAQVDSVGELTSGHGVIIDGSQIVDGRLYSAQAAPGTLNSTGTLTAALLMGGIVTSTSAAAVAATVDTGTAMDNALLDTAIALAADKGFEWSLINTGPNTVTVTAATGHTLVGTMTVVTLVSARFLTRRVSADTFVTYRLAG